MAVITYDAPAHGRSSGTRTTLPQFAAAVRAVAESMGTMHGIVAHSFGCAAVTLALRDGLNVARLVFVAPPVDPEDYTRRFGEVLRLDRHVVEGMKQRIERRFHRKWSDYSVEKTAAKMTAPLLVIHDQDDQEIALDESRRIVDAWPSARLMVTSGLGHRRILRDNLVTQTAAGFLRAD